MLFHNSCHVGFLRATPAARLAASREDPLPTLEPADVLPERLAEELTATPALRASDAVDLTCKGRGQRDRDRSR